MDLHIRSGTVVRGDVWAADAGDVDERVLARVPGPVLDVGCGPGRHVRALTARGVVAMGIDLTPEVVRCARLQGTDVLERCVFAPIPAAGRWRTALLLDGNVGIGGDPVTLLRRLAALLADDGAVLVEAAPPGRSGPADIAHVQVGGRPGPPFLWRVIGSDQLAAAGSAAGLAVGEEWVDTGRRFAWLRKR